MRILVHTAYKLSAPACCPASCIACSIRRSLGEGWKSEEGREPEQPAYSRVVRSRKRVVHVASSRTNPAICTLPSKKWGGDRIASPSRCARQTRGAATAASQLRGSFRTLAPLLTQKNPLRKRSGFSLVGLRGCYYEPVSIFLKRKSVPTASDEDAVTKLEQCAARPSGIERVTHLDLRRHAAYRQPAASLYLAQRNDDVRPHYLNVDERQHLRNIDVLPHSLHSEHEHH